MLRIPSLPTQKFQGSFSLLTLTDNDFHEILTWGMAILIGCCYNRAIRRAEAEAEVEAEVGVNEGEGDVRAIKREG